MKTITQHITERLQLNKDRVQTPEKKKCIYFPKTKEELKDIIYKITDEHKNDKVIDLNIIDTSEITDMSELFAYSKFNGDISQWDVSNVTDMNGIFYQSDFNNDISQWNVSQVKDMNIMFKQSKFNQDISQWDVSSVEDMTGMFSFSEFKRFLSIHKPINFSLVSSFK